ncbi:MAG TPA: potassium-transporting ATPase subunit KdpA [Stellaceae bacterium]|nr:potassium-transporting ATPase subunit KdpA [Stellaceae bacterium]
MNAGGWGQIALFAVIVVLITRPFGGYMTRVFAGERTLLSPLLRPVERAVYRCCGIDENEEQHWLIYAAAMLLFSVVGFATLYALARLQWYLPFNPQGQTGLAPDLAFNTALSFVTNTNWQNYGGETTMGYLVQMAGLTVHNFLSAATGIALALALIRGFARREAKAIGNFWVDLTRATLYVLLPISVVVALFYVWQGVPQNLNAYVDATTLEGARQTIAQGPVASQEAIKIFGTNGGGFFNANSAHPYENPTALANLVQLVTIFAIGAGLTNVLGRMVKDERQGWTIFAAMGALFLVGATVVYWSEAHGNPAFAAFAVDAAPSAWQAGGNMEGKEVRFGPALSALYATVTTDTSCGCVNAMHDSFLPLGGMIALVDIELGEVIFGGVGSGLYGMLAFAIVAMFVAGLMVGRTPEYLGKKLEAKEVKMTILALLSLPLSILGFTALAAVVPAGLAGIANGGPHGFSEILYAYSSATGNNGSAFAGLSGNTSFYNVTLAFAMLIGRFVFVIPLLAVAGSLAQKKLLAPSAGTFPTNRPLFVGLLVGVVLIIGGLTYFPALSLGPVTEQVAMNQGHLYSSP